MAHKQKTAGFSAQMKSTAYGMATGGNLKKRPPGNISAQTIPKSAFTEGHTHLSKPSTDLASLKWSYQPRLTMTEKLKSL